MKHVDRVFLGMELKVIAHSLMWKEAVLVVQYNIISYFRGGEGGILLIQISDGVSGDRGCILVSTLQGGGVRPHVPHICALTI